ncbi:hypothetical protein [Trinickia fusca]|uniref:hypothetical protein n=1 Tax=Trinickia fusca TaxID=2419777 RepID=UPI0011C3BD0E|nr:hypothetical protein [Trinickia fusca]
MADANLKPHPSRTRLRDSCAVTLRDSPDYGTTQPTPAFMPWMQVADLWLHRVGFASGQRMRLSFDYRNHCLTISPERF